MKAATICTLLGLLALGGLGWGFLGIDPLVLLRCFGASCLAGLIALLGVTFFERTSALRGRVFRGPLVTWSVFLGLYFSVLVGLAPVLRDWRTMAVLCIPLTLGEGFTILIFGEIQDRLVARTQRKKREFARNDAKIMV